MHEQAQGTFDDYLLHLVQAETPRLTAELQAAARASMGNEDQLIMKCDVLLAGIAERLHLQWEPQGERRVIRLGQEGARRSGFIDRLFNRVVVEFEAPGALQADSVSECGVKGLVE